MMNEIWKRSTIVDRIEVSNLGNVRNFKDKSVRYSYIHSRGYVHLRFKVNGKRKEVKVHRLVAQEFCDKPDGCGVVNHINAIKHDNRAINLEWTTQLENMRHAHNLGLVPVLAGEANGRAVLNEELVHLICKEYELGHMPKYVIEKFGITRNQAVKIKCKTSWKHITLQYKY